MGTLPLPAKPEPEWLLCDPVGIPSPCLTELKSRKDGGKCVKAGNYNGHQTGFRSKGKGHDRFRNSWLCYKKYLWGG